LQQATTIVKIHMLLKTNTPMNAEIAEEQDTVELDGETEAVHAQLNQLTSKKLQYLPPGKFGQQSRGAGNRTIGQTGKPNTNFKAVICCVCRKKGHLQDECYTCIAKGLPCVHANGVRLKSQPPTPLTRMGRVAEIGQQEANGGHHGGESLLLCKTPLLSQWQII
jgi:hypothetical protein